MDLLWIGVFWLILTTVFEFGFGHYVMVDLHLRT